MKKILLWIWQFPQHLLAFLILLLYKNRSMVIVHDEDGTLIYLISELGWGVSLGKYILMDMNYGDRTLDHERGHSKQSKMLGPLYLILIGIPSILMNLFSMLMYDVFSVDYFMIRYYKRWPESWADKLGGVMR